MSRYTFVVSIVADDLEAFEKAVESVRLSILDHSVSAHLPYYGNGDGYGTTLQRVGGRS